MVYDGVEKEFLRQLVCANSLILELTKTDAISYVFFNIIKKLHGIFIHFKLK